MEKNWFKNANKYFWYIWRHKLQKNETRIFLSFIKNKSAEENEAFYKLSRKWVKKEHEIVEGSVEDAVM